MFPFGILDLIEKNDMWLVKWMHGWCGWYDGMIDVDVLERIGSIEFYLWGVLKLVGIVPFGSTGSGVLYN